jgi:subtilase family serine protease
MRWPLLALVPLVALFVVTGSAGSVAAGNSPASPGPMASSALVTDAVALPSGVTSTPLPASTPMTLTLTLSNPHAGSLAAFLSQVEDPMSPDYRHFVTFPEFLDRFSPSASQLANVSEALRAAGASEITPSPDRSSVSGVLTAGSVEHLLGVHLESYGTLAGLRLYTSAGPVALPSSLAGMVSGVGGLSDVATAVLDAQQSTLALEKHPIPLLGGEFSHVNSTGENWYIGSDFAQLYHVTDLFPGNGSVANATYPQSVAIATLLVSSYNQSVGGNGNLPPFDPNVVHTYLNQTLGPGWPVSTVTGVPVPIDGVVPPLPGSFGNVNDSLDYEVENSLDLEMAGSLAPGAALYNFYFGANLLNGSVTNGDAADYFAMDLAEALAYPYSPQHLAAISCSFGLPDLDAAAWDAELLTAAATGITLVAASGDQGNAPDSLTGRSDGPWPVWPASDAKELSGALSAGGVSIDVSGTPTSYFSGSSLNISYDPNVGTLTSVTAWYDTTGGQGSYAGTEGGISTVYPEPYWQFHSAAEAPIVNATVLQGASTLGRAEPDLAMPANDTLATVLANSTGAVFFLPLEGTSIAAPVIAGLLADIVAVDNHNASSAWTSLGFIDPLIYQFASYFAMHPGARTDPFLDVTMGSNYVFAAGPGWDATTGWGEVDAPAFLAALHNSTLLDYNYSGPTPVLPSAPSSPSGTIPYPVIFAIFGVGVIVAIVLVAVAARPSRHRAPPPNVPWGAQGGATTRSGAPVSGGVLPGATFLCPYCGAIRPAEPVRCPQCGAL